MRVTHPFDVGAFARVHADTLARGHEFRYLHRYTIAEQGRLSAGLLVAVFMVGAVSITSSSIDEGSEEIGLPSTTPRQSSFRLHPRRIVPTARVECVIAHRFGIHDVQPLRVGVENLHVGVKRATSTFSVALNRWSSEDPDARLRNLT